MICFCCQEDTSRFVLEKRNALVKRPKITDYNEIYILLDQYEKVRQLLEQHALESSLEKENISKKLQALRDKYSHETIVEIDVAETNNQRTVDIKEEDGLSIGEIRFGRDTIRLITKGSIVVSRDEKPKVKRK